MRLLGTILISLMLLSGQAEAQQSPCDDPDYLELKEKPFYKLTGLEKRKLESMSRKCDEYNRAAAAEDYKVTRMGWVNPDGPVGSGWIQPEFGWTRVPQGSISGVRLTSQIWSIGASVGAVASKRATLLVGFAAVIDNPHASQGGVTISETHVGISMSVGVRAYFGADSWTWHDPVGY